MDCTYPYRPQYSLFLTPSYDHRASIPVDTSMSFEVSIVIYVHIICIVHYALKSNFKNVCIVNYRTSPLLHLLVFTVRLLPLPRDTHLMWYLFYYVVNI